MSYGRVKGAMVGFFEVPIISTDFLQTVNLSRIGGTASPTSEISIGANLPSRSNAGDTHKMDVQVFDTLGTANGISFEYVKKGANEWDLKVEPPTGTAVLNLYDDNGAVHKSIGQLEFTGTPAAGSTFSLEHVSPDGSIGPTKIFEVVNSGTPADGQILIPAGLNAVEAVRAIRNAINDYVNEEYVNGEDVDFATIKSGQETVLLLHGSGDIPSFNIKNIAVTNTDNNVGTVQTAPFLVSQTATTEASIKFDKDGLPAGFNVATMSVSGFANGAADLSSVTLDFGTIGEADGMTQFGADFTPTSVQQNGARYGMFSGVTIASDGLVTALFDNGEMRPIYKIPLATFVNPNGLESRSGNAWTATQASGNPTLGVADQGPAGQVTQSALEASTVDIANEFTDMIVVQRAYSAATKIISTADEMLEELGRLKR